MRNLKNLISAGLTALVMTGCEKSYDITQRQMNYIYRKEVRDKIYYAKQLMYVDSLIKEDKNKEALKYLNNCLANWFNHVESYQSRLRSDNFLPDSVIIDLDNELELMQDKIWNM